MHWPCCKGKAPTPWLERRASARGRIEQGQGSVDALGALHIHRQGVEKDVRQGVARDLGQAGVALTRNVAAGRLVQASGTNHQNAFGAQVHGR